MTSNSVSLSPNQAQAHLFDLDGTLIVSDAALGKAWRAWAETVGVERDSEPWNDIVNLSRAKSVGSFMKEFVGEFGSKDAQERLSSSEALEDEESKWFASQVEPARDGTDGVEAIKGAVEYFNQLIERGQKVVLFSSTWPEVAQGRLANAFFNLDGVTYVHPSELEEGKPSPEGYLDAAEAIGVPIEQCVVYEDAAKGLKAGQASGAYSVAVRTTDEDPETLLALADIVIHDLSYVSLTANGDVRFRNAVVPENSRLGRELSAKGTATELGS